jgi:hypothetical protein
MLTFSFCSFTQAALEPAGEEKLLCFFSYVKAFHGLGVQDAAEFDSD